MRVVIPSDLGEVARQVLHDACFTLTTNGQLMFVPSALAQPIVDHCCITRGPGGGLWFYDDGVFRPEAEALVKDAVRTILAEDFRAARLREVEAWCSTLPITIRSDPPPEHLLPVANGVLNIETLELRPATREDGFTFRLPIRWNPEATCPAIAAFMAEVLKEDALYLAGEVLGMCILPTGRFRRAVMLLGGGGNGKSVFLQVVESLLGSNNVANIPLHTLAENRFAVAGLFGKLANISADLDARPLDRSDVFKTLTGNDPVSAEKKFHDQFSFTSFATLVYACNEWPVSRDQTHAYFSRWIALQFDQHFREDDGPLEPGERRADPRLREKLTTQEELEGLLVAAVRGARRLRERGGFKVPQSVRDAVADYRSWADTVIAFVDETVTPAEAEMLTRSAVYRAYVDWCKANGRSEFGSKRFWPRLREVLAERGIAFEETKHHADRVVRGLRMEGAVKWPTAV